MYQNKICGLAKKKVYLSRVIFAAVLLMAFLLSACNTSNLHKASEPLIFNTYLDIPGITEAEKNAIENFKREGLSFTYGMTETTEAFIGADGEIGGFAVLLSEWLSELFGIPFNLNHYTWNGLLDGLRSGEIDFTSDLASNEERRRIYFMTDTFTFSPLKYYRLSSSTPLSEIRETRLPRYALLEGTITIDVVLNYAIEDFELVYAKEYDHAYDLLLNGEADAIIFESTVESYYDGYGEIPIVLSDFFPLLYTSNSLTTQNPALLPIISVVQKALDNGAMKHFHELYRQGERDYQKHKLNSQLTEEEQKFIIENPAIPLAAEYNVYPTSFYSYRDNEWHGIAHDILKEVESLTGLSFKIINEPGTPFLELFDLLTNGEAAIITELIPTDERSGNFLWPGTAHLNANYILISHQDFPNIKISDIHSVKVGFSQNTVYSQMFKRWFPSHDNYVEYANPDDVFVALIDGEIDMMMHSTIGLLSLTHYQELVEYKANIVFDNELTSIFGFNKNEIILASIMDKALSVISTDTITGQWLYRTYDYRAKLSEARLAAQYPWIIGVGAMLIFILFLVSAFLLKSQRTEKQLEELVTERTKELKEAEEKALLASHAKSAFLANMSHEIRTPMNSIMGFAELALNLNATPKVSGYLAKIIESTKLLLRIINDILDISKIESGKMELENVPFDLQEVISRCQSVIQPNAHSKSLELKFYAERVRGKKMLGDPVRLYQVLLNLLSNAVKFTDSGYVKLSAAVVGDSFKEPGETVAIYFEVQDSGIGMSGEQLKKVLAPFVQADSSTTRNYGGTGLGLAISKNIIELMGGKLAIESLPGSGSIFSFTINFATIDDAFDSPSLKLETIERPHFEGTILVCDDNILNQHVIHDNLVNLGLKTVLADNGKIGVDLVRERQNSGEEPFDLIMMDMFMPIMDGIEAASKIIALGVNTPIIAVTSNVMTSEIEKYKQCGMPDYLGKPFTAQELWHILLKYLTPIADNGEAGPKAIDEEELKQKLLLDFVKANSDKITELEEAISASNFKVAHRLAHSLKGNAAQIGRNELAILCGQAEKCFEHNEFPPPETIDLLKEKLNFVLEELRPLLDEAVREKPALMEEEAKILLAELLPLLEQKNIACLDLLDDVRRIPGAGELADKIDSCDFKGALVALRELMR
ncbi:MAG: transporter substrate-binding domain-containing protein [Lachnospiraceae bacterium]|nr:transporter substrate-binding domain-containing protein [Lachnospiraceae bacterium]